MLLGNRSCVALIPSIHGHIAFSALPTSMWVVFARSQGGGAIMSMDGRYFARSQGGGAIMSMDGRYFARSQGGGAIMSRKYGQIFAPRQLLLGNSSCIALISYIRVTMRCPNKLLPCNDAISALPPSMAVVFARSQGGGAVISSMSNKNRKCQSLSSI